MATKHTSEISPDEVPSGEGKTFGIVVSDWNSEITNALLDGCRSKLKSHGVSDDHILEEHVPGSFELPMGARILISGKKLDGVICIGCVIKGETDHDRYISQSVASGIMQLGLMMNVPVIFGVLTPNNMDQAKARAGGDLGNKGEEAAIAALRMAQLKEMHGKAPHKIGFG